MEAWWPDNHQPRPTVRDGKRPSRGHGRGPLRGSCGRSMPDSPLRVSEFFKAADDFAQTLDRYGLRLAFATPETVSALLSLLVDEKARRTFLKVARRYPSAAALLGLPLTRGRGRPKGSGSPLPAMSVLVLTLAVDRCG